MNWKKIGNIFAPQHQFSWMVSHAANPFPEYLEADVFRIYFTCRDLANRSHIAFADIDFADSYRIKNISREPVLAPGEAGLFDDSGVAMGCMIKINNKKYLYYLGWNLKVTVPWMNTIGLAVSDDDGASYRKYSRVPLLDRSNEDPFSISYPFILYDNGIYKMWYGSNLTWGKDQHEMHHIVKYAHSPDGIRWNRNSETAVPLIYQNEYAISKPVIVKGNNFYEMWYSYRGRNNIRTYRIGYATSADGMKWIRTDDKAGIDVSAHGWDSEMICYPFIFDYKGYRYMLYNGNGYGKTGFGLAVFK